MNRANLAIGLISVTGAFYSTFSRGLPEITKVTELMSTFSLPMIFVGSIFIAFSFPKK